MMVPKVSVIVPVYNARAYVQRCVELVLAQSLHAIEVVVVDDGSTDGSAELLDELAFHEARLKVIHQPNRGAAAARNCALAAATGEFVAFMDVDDEYPANNILEQLYTEAIAAGVSICGGNFALRVGHRLRTHFKGLDTGYEFTQRAIVNYCDYQFDYGFTRFIYSRQLLQRHTLLFPALHHFEDPPFFVAAMQAARRFLALPLITYQYNADVFKPHWAANHWQRVHDLLTGLALNIAFARQHHLTRLERLTLARVDQEYGEVFYHALRQDPTLKLRLQEHFPNCLALRLLQNPVGALYWRIYWFMRICKRHLERVEL